MHFLKTHWLKMLGLGLLLLVGYLLLRGEEDSASQKPQTLVSVEAAKLEDVPLVIDVPGNVIAYESVAIRARLDSQITAVQFQDGDAVVEGQPLFQLDDRALKAQIRELEATVRKDKAQLENARLQYERLSALVKNNFVSTAQADAAKATYDSQQAIVKATQASLENAKVLLSYAVIKAPISGRAGTIHVTAGNTVKANDAVLVTLNRVQPIGVQFAVPERHYAALRQALQGEVGVTAIRKGSAEKIIGKLEYIDNKIDTSTGSFLARANFANTDEALWPGMYLNVSVELGVDKAALTIPAYSLLGDEGAHFVYRVVEGKAVRTPVEVIRNNGTKVLIAKGVQQGDLVITDGLLRVSDGAAVATQMQQK